VSRKLGASQGEVSPRFVDTLLGNFWKQGEIDIGKGIRFTDEFKQDAVAQVVERGYAVSEVAERLGICTKSLYTWKAQFSQSPQEGRKPQISLLRSND